MQNDVKVILEFHKQIKIRDQQTYKHFQIFKHT